MLCFSLILPSLGCSFLLCFRSAMQQKQQAKSKRASGIRGRSFGHFWMFTPLREIGKLDGIKVRLVGEPANGRTVRSLAYLLAKYSDVTPDVVKMKDDIKSYLTSMGVKSEESVDLMEVASECDMVYKTRIQKE